MSFVKNHAERMWACNVIHALLVDDQHLAPLLRQYQRYFNESRPHQAPGTGAAHPRF